MITATIIADSINESGNRITTYVLKYPRFIHSELMTHRAFSRNAASSRAIPIEKLISMVENEPAAPSFWGKNQKGMQAFEELPLDIIRECEDIWNKAMKEAVHRARQLALKGAHKQVANRLLEPFAHMTTLVTATEFENFFALRAHADAQPEFRILAERMLTAYNESVPKLKKAGEWHLPFGDSIPEWVDEPNNEGYRLKITDEHRRKIVTARAARVSYLTFDGLINVFKDFELHDSLAESGHWSPFEHAAEAMSASERSGNFIGWKPYRKYFEHENRKDPRVIKKATN